LNSTRQPKGLKNQIRIESQSTKQTRRLNKCTRYSRKGLHIEAAFTVIRAVQLILDC